MYILVELREAPVDISGVANFYGAREGATLDLKGIGMSGPHFQKSSTAM